MKIFRLSVLLAIASAVLAGAVLFATSQKVQQQEDKLAALQNATRSEEAHIRVLKAEWDYLNRPDRLEGLVKVNMGMDVLPPDDVLRNVRDVPEPLYVAPPSRKPQFNVVPVSMGGKSALEGDEPKQKHKPLPVREEENFSKLLGKIQRGDLKGGGAE